MDMDNLLTHDAIRRMFHDDHPPKKPFLQVLGTSIIQHRGIKCAMLVLSDGQYFNNCYLVPKMNVDVLIPPSVYCFITVGHYHRSVIETPDGHMQIYIEIDAMVQFTPRSEIKYKIGEPQQFDESTIPTPSNILKTVFLTGKAPLTDYALSAIFSMRYYSRPVLQILSAKMIQRSDGERQRNMALVVSDNRQVVHVVCSQPLSGLLEKHLKELKLSIVQFDEYGYGSGEFVLHKMTWMNWGAHLCFNSAHLHSQKALLTQGFLRHLLAHGRWVPRPIVQIVKSDTVVHRGVSRMRLVLFDGECVSDAFLSTQLKECLPVFELKRSIVCLDIYKANTMTDNSNTDFPNGRSSVSICALSLLNLRPTVEFNWSAVSGIPRLTNSFIRKLISGTYVAKPVVKIVKVSTLFNGITLKRYIRVLLYDGVYTCSGILPKSMNHLQPMLERLPVVCLDRYYVRTKSGADRLESLLIIKEMTALSLADYILPSLNVLELQRVVIPFFDDDL